MQNVDLAKMCHTLINPHWTTYPSILAATYRDDTHAVPGCITGNSRLSVGIGCVAL